VKSETAERATTEQQEEENNMIEDGEVVKL